MIGVLTIPMIKLTQRKVTDDSPFYDDKGMSAMRYASKYVRQGIICIAFDF